MRTLWMLAAYLFWRQGDATDATRTATYNFAEDQTDRPIDGREAAFLIAYALLITAGVLLVWLWPEAARAGALETDLPAIAIITAANKDVRTIEVTNGQCLKMQAFLAQNDLYIEDTDLPRQAAVRVECHCVSLDPGS